MKPIHILPIWVLTVCAWVATGCDQVKPPAPAAMVFSAKVVPATPASSAPPIEATAQPAALPPVAAINGEAVVEATATSAPAAPTPSPPALVAAPAPPAASPARPAFGGIFVMAPMLDRGGSQAAIAGPTYVAPGIDGVAILPPWGQVEPQPGVFDWTAFDAVFLPALAAGKKFDVGIIGASYVPAWIYAAPYNVPSLTFTSGHPGKKSGNCDSITVPIWWNETLQDRFRAVLLAEAAHVHTIPGGDAAVVLAKSALMGTESGEFRVWTTTGAPCSPANDSQMWAGVHYTPALALQAWAESAAAVHAAFPGVELSQDLLLKDSDSEPSIDDTGAVFPRGKLPGVPLLTRVINLAAQTYGKSIMIQSDDMTPTSASPSVAQAKAAGTLIGFQTNASGGSGAATCDADATAGPPCDAAGYAAILAHTQQLGAVMTEVHPRDVLSFGPQIVAASAALGATP